MMGSGKRKKGEEKTLNLLSQPFPILKINFSHPPPPRKIPLESESRSRQYCFHYFPLFLGTGSVAWVFSSHFFNKFIHMVTWFINCSWHKFKFDNLIYVLYGIQIKTSRGTQKSKPISEIFYEETQWVSFIETTNRDLCGSITDKTKKGTCSYLQFWQTHRPTA